MTNLLKRNSWTLDLDKLPAYVEWGGDWKYSIDGDMIRLILDCDEVDSFGNPKITPAMKSHFKRNVVDKMQNGTLHIKWTGRRGNLGRRYSAPDPSDHSRAASNLGVHSKYIKNTLYQYMGWVDYDMVAGHPTILCEIAKITNTLFPAIENYITHRSEIMAELADYYSVVGATPEETAKNRITPEDIKYLYNLTIYGGGFSTWVKNTTEGDEKYGFLPRPVANRPLHPLYSAYYADVRNASNLIYTFNPQLVSSVCGNENLDEWKRKSRTMSYFCGIIENDCLKYAYKYGVKNGLFPARSGDLCYDGFTMPPPPEGIDLDYHITQMNAFIGKHTGLAIQMKVKPLGSVIQSILDKRAAMTAPTVAPTDEVDESTETRKYNAWKAEFEKEWCKLRNSAVFVRRYTENGVFKRYVFLSKDALKIAYADVCYRGSLGMIPMVCRWLADSTIRAYDDIGVFPPPLECPANILNTWEMSPYHYMPFETEKIEDDPAYDADAVQRFVRHIDILCNGDTTIRDWIISWAAHSIQKPSEKPEHALNFIGQQGTGKSTIFNTLGKLYGAGKVLETSTPERDVYGNFNAPMIGAYLVVLSEVDKRNSAGADGKIKALLTDYKMVINQKGKDQIEITSCHRVGLTSNSLDPIKTSKDDRRNLLIRCSDSLKGNAEYFKSYNATFDRPNALRSLYWWLNSYDISAWNFRNVPKTDYHKTIIEHTENPIVSFMEWFVMQHFNEETVVKTGVEMLTEFQEWKTATHYSFEDRLHEGALLKKIKTECGFPEGCITRGNRTKSGFKNTFHIGTMKSHFKLGCLVETADGEFQEV